MVTPNSPSSRIWSTMSAGNRSSCSRADATGMTSLATNRRTVSMISRRTSGSVGSVAVGPDAGSVMDENTTFSSVLTSIS